MKKLLLFIFFVFAIQLSMAQTPGVIAADKYGGAADDLFFDVIRLKNGNTVCAGISSSTNNHSTGNHGDQDFFLACFSDRGQTLWTKMIGGSGTDGGTFVGNGEVLSATADGGFFFGGTTTSSDGDISFLSNGGYDIFIARCDKDGNILWKKTFGGNASDFISGIIATADGGCIFSASTNSSNNTGDISGKHGGNDIWIVKLNATGVIEWSKLYGGSGNETATSFIATNDGGYAFAGTTEGAADGDLAGTVPAGTIDIWITKLNATGTIEWHRRFGGSDWDENPRLIQARSGDYFILASTRSANGDFTINEGLSDWAFIKLNSAGTVSFIKTMGGGSADGGNDLLESEDGNIVLTGISYSFNRMAGISFQNKGECDMILTKVDKSSGNIMWMSVLGGESFDFIRSLCWGNGREIIAVGTTSSTTGDFPNTLGGRDAFVLKIAPFNVVKGYVFYDNNGNGVKESAEPLVENINVTTRKNDNYSVSSYTQNGSYFNEVDSGSFVTKPRLFNSDYYTVTPDSFTNSFPAYYGLVTQNFGLRPIAGKRDLRSAIVAINPARPGFTSYYKLICYNVGTETIAAGTVKLIKDSRTTLQSSTPKAFAITGDTLIWQFANFKPLDTLAFDIVLDLARPPAIKIGDWIKYETLIEPTVNDLVPGDNKFTLYHIVTGSFDPNDKMESHGALYSSIELSKREHLNYTIRFQNTGNDTAFNVEVIDTLDNKLDLSTFELLATSHKAELTILNNICSWKFKNIKLPDSNRNEPGSHGFISYRIKPASNVKIYDTIKNSASIYFDYNEPIVTNTYTTVIRLPLPAMPDVSSLPLTYCNNLAAQKIKLINIPGANYHANVVVKVDDKVLNVAADSTITIEPATLTVGLHKLTIDYVNSDTSAQFKQDFNIRVPVKPEVSLTANSKIITELQTPVTIEAKNVNGGGTAPVYTFARNRQFTDIVQTGTQHVLTLQPASLNVGDNTFYVKLQTSDSCFTSKTAIDSITIQRSAVTGIIDPDNPDQIISVSPNPFNEEIVVNGLSNNVSKLLLFDATGRLLISTQTLGQSLVRLKPPIASGICYLVIYNRKKQPLGVIKLLKRL
jgi:hypothetical protein